MGISKERHQAHVAEWQGKFANYKKKWPKFLFHHASIENAIGVLKNGGLLSRNAAEASGSLQNDIAPEEIIQNRDAAHGYARLYFRPRTPTQFHIEGIRKPSNYYKGKHAGFLVMLAFDSENVLTMPSTQFSTCNMQSPYSQVLNGDDGFDELDFAGIYHDEAYPSDDEKRKRCAEVLAQSPLDLSALAAIVVRTDADMATMKFLLAREGLENLVPKVKRSLGTGVFFHNYTAVQFVDSAPGRVSFKLKTTRSPGNIHTEVTAINDMTGESYALVSQELKPDTNYYTTHSLSEGYYRLHFSLEGCYAHESILLLN